MKRLLIFASLITMLTTGATAAPRNTFYFLIGQQNINIEFKYDNVRFNTGMTDTELTNFRNAYQPQWEKAFIHELNDELEDFQMIVQRNPNATYTIQVIPTQTSSYGFTHATIQIIDKQGAVIHTIQLKERAEREHSIIESYIDSMQELGEQLGNIIGKGL